MFKQIRNQLFNTQSTNLSLRKDQTKGRINTRTRHNEQTQKEGKKPRKRMQTFLGSFDVGFSCFMTKTKNKIEQTFNKFPNN